MELHPATLGGEMSCNRGWQSACMDESHIADNLISQEVVAVEAQCQDLQISCIRNAVGAAKLTWFGVTCQQI